MSAHCNFYDVDDDGGGDDDDDDDDEHVTVYDDDVSGFLYQDKMTFYDCQWFL